MYYVLSVSESVFYQRVSSRINKNRKISIRSHTLPAAKEMFIKSQRRENALVDTILRLNNKNIKINNYNNMVD